MKISRIHTLATGFFFTSVLFAQSVRNLCVEYTETPLGIDVVRPRFSWQLVDKEGSNGLMQTAYRIVVKDEQGRTVWDSGKQNADTSLNIEYSGEALKPETRYDWTVDVWAGNARWSNGKHSVKIQSLKNTLTADSWFETGLMAALAGNTDSWSGAQWIGGCDGDMVLYSHYLPVFGLSCDIQIMRGGTCAGFIYGANDERLTDKNMNIYGIESAHNQSYIKMELDITAVNKGGDAVLNIYRCGYHPKDKEDAPFKTFTVGNGIVDKGNMYGKHTVSLKSNLGQTTLWIEGLKSDGSPYREKLGDVNLNPLGVGGDFIAFPVVGDVCAFIPDGQKAEVTNFKIENYRTPTTVIWQTDKLSTGTGAEVEGWSAYMPEGNSSPMLRTVFIPSDKNIAKARLYVTARGIYDIYMNGERISEDYFNPGLTQYDKTHLYQTFDVTGHIKQGKNALGAILAEGWWSGGATFMGEYWNFFGDRQSLLAKLVITYTDGTHTTIVSNPGEWQFYGNGPIQYGSFFQGEVYDATKEKNIEGWCIADYDASAWKHPETVGLSGTVAFDSRDCQFVGQFGQTVKAVRTLTAQSVEEVRPGVFVYDMGQNMAGVPEISMSGITPGTKIKMRFAEVKYPDLPEYAGHEGMVMMENIRAAMAQDIYVAKGGEESFSPRYTYHGYRFIEITGLEHPLPVESVKSKVLSSIHELTSDYKTSDAKVNKLWENITWSTLANFISIPTDCPQRNERLGWSGDISVFSRTATYLADVTQFLRRHLLNMRDTQCEDGRFTDVAPIGCGFGGLLWGSAGITVAWESYRQYADKAMLAEHYDAMVRYIDYVEKDLIDPETDILVQHRQWGDLCDWLGPEDGRNDKSLVWEAYYIYDLELMSRIAGILGRQDDAERFEKRYNSRKQFFLNTYVEPATGKTMHSAFEPAKQGQIVDTQTSYALPLAFGIIDESKDSLLYAKFVNNFVESVCREGAMDNGKKSSPYSLLTGFIGTAWISQALSDCGHTELAYRLLLQTDYPSWLYSVEQGATTIWERLNSYTHTDGFGGNNRMNSFNHYSFGAVGSWMLSHSLGIMRDDTVDAFKRIVLAPETDPTGTLTFADGYYDSPYGRIESHWKKNTSGTTEYEFAVPANTSAELRLPVSALENLTEGGKKISKNKGITVVHSDAKEKADMSFMLLPGKYRFEMK
ncbi:MAG: glycoside hydrolase family 78 protein [Bacteroides sp.]|nr:glycoside hydrolase family 78 protein [Roseburia sp.]MCM1345960.1 glycoside hydrolase family 78 protein [Bacteroides sp.]MCM1420897.1 glycoside hydrolase family 78 protein [Bacteroides sp.]